MKIKDLKFRVRHNEDWEDDENTRRNFVWSEPFTLMDAIDTEAVSTPNGTYIQLDEDFEIEIVEVKP